MFADLQNKYDWVQPLIMYSSKEKLLEQLDERVVKPALEMHNKLVARKAKQLEIIEI